MDYFFVNNTLETYTIDGSGAIATHISAVRAAAVLAGVHPVVITRGDRTRRPLDAGPTRVVSGLPRLPDLLVRLSRKASRRAGWQSHHEFWHARRVLRVLRRSPSEGPRVLVCHNDPDVADFLATRLTHDVVLHVWHNVLPHGRSRHPRVRHLAVSRYLAGAVRDLAAAHPATLPNGVDSTAFRPRPRPPGPLTVSFLGRTGREKGPDILLHALLALPPLESDVRVLLIGSNTWGERIEDPYQAELAELVRRLRSRGMTVEETGHLGRGEVAAVLATSDIHVVPSRWEDPAPLVLMEAMATGLCSIAARSGGMPEYGGDACLWFEREDVEGLTAQLLLAMQDSSLRERLGRRSRRRAEELSWDQTWSGVRVAAES